MSMTSPSPRELDRLSVSLVQQASVLTRLVFRHAETELSRSEASILATLEHGPQRITALAEQEGLAQPTVTVLVGNLEARGLVAREGDPADGRAVLVSLTEAGRVALARSRESYRPLLRRCLAALPPERLAALEDASGALDELIAAIHEEVAR